jgi:hypothetical protein
MPDISQGTIKSTNQGGGDGIITEDGTGADLSFINPRIPSITPGERFDFFKIIQNTPNGSKVIIILKGKLPDS